MESISEGVKARVRGIRDQQDRLSIKKAEATIEYAVRVERYIFRLSRLIKIACGRETSQIA